MSREESLKLALKKMKEAKNPREYALAMTEHFERFKTPSLIEVPSSVYSEASKIFDGGLFTKKDPSMFNQRV